jgi:hypothetical protein
MNFYRDVSISLNSLNQKQTQNGMHSSGYSSSSNPRFNYGYWSSDNLNIDSKVGDQNTKDLKPGWLWGLAMKHSGGNSSIAMDLIGMCGHDDTAQSNFAYKDSSDEAMLEISDRIKILKERKQILEKQIKQSAKDSKIDTREFIGLTRDFSRLTSQIKKLEKETFLKREMPCPPGGSAFYSPGGLGAEADISDDLKQKIKKIQNPKGAVRIPAKHYHVYGSAFMACKLINDGMGPDKAVLIQKQAARMYRGIRMCSSSNELEESSEALKKIFEADLKSTNSEPADIILRKLNANNFTGDCKDLKGEQYEFCNSVIEAFGDVSIDFRGNQELARNKIKGRLARIDAAELYKAWYVGGYKILGAQVPCTDVRLGGPRNLMDANNSVSFVGARPSGWSKEKYDLATKVLATWDVDFEWTVAQHEAGSKFAAKNCKPNSGADPMEVMCDKKSAPETNRATR